MMYRPPTPQILHDPIVDEEEEAVYGWYYGKEAGGHVINFGKFRGQKINRTSLPYLYWCDRTFDPIPRFIPFLDAFHNFHDGLEEYAKTNYEEFIVPFGRKHRGKTLKQCRDKPWLTWVDRALSRKRIMLKKYGVFFQAVKQWLAHPRHQEVHRDIGELLDASQYEDDLDLRQEFRQDYEDEPTESDLEFIVSDEETPVEESDSNSESSAQATEEGTGNDGDGGDSDSESSAQSTSDSDQPLTELRRHNRRKGASRRVEDDFIEEDEVEDGSANYTPPRTPDREEVAEISSHGLRSSTKKTPARHSVPPSSPSPTPARRSKGKAHARSPTLVASGNDSEGDESSDPEETFQSFTQRVISSVKKKTTVGIPSSPPTSPIHPRVRRDRVRPRSPSSDSETHLGKSPRKRARKPVSSSSQAKGAASQREGSRINEVSSSRPPVTPRRVKSGRRLYKVADASNAATSPVKQEQRITIAAPQIIDDTASQTRMVADYFASIEHLPKLPPHVQRALETLVFYVHEQQNVIDTETIMSDDSDPRMIS